MTLPPKIGPGTIVDGAIHPGWTWDFLRNEPITFANVVGLSDEDGSSAVTLSEHMARQFDPALSWDDVDWLRTIWDGPIVLKGVQTVADAKQAVSAMASRASGCRTTAAASSTTRRRRSTWSNPFATRSATAPRSSATAGSGGGATS
jgi:isopentenyl diphosphate isomerase/L-lactate dehydrogenase-like FMN-dependent dehydrogenase